MNEEDRDPGWARDPGWREAVQGAWLYLVPFGLQLRLRKLDQEGADGLVVLRSVLLAFSGAIVLFAIVLTLLNPPAPDATATMWTALGIVAYGALVIYVLVPRFERPLRCESDVVLASTYRTRFFLQLALVESVALAGFVAVFLVGPAWLYYVAGVATLLGFARHAPTMGNLIRDQADLLSRGCERSLIGALRHPRPSPDPS